METGKVRWSMSGAVGLLKSPIALSILILLACWPVCRWYFARMLDGSDEPWGGLALFAAVGFSVASRSWNGLGGARLWGVCSCLFGLVVFQNVFTPLIQGILVAGALSFALADRRCWIGHTGLFLLSLPLISSLQFYGGYPLRLLIGKLSSAMLNVFGQHVESAGSTLLWRGEAIVIDAPCSGVQMLWGSAFFACLLICINRLRAGKSLQALQIASLSAFVANVVRNCLLFFIESGQVAFGDWAHDVVGILLFVGALAFVGWFSMRASRKDSTSTGKLERSFAGGSSFSPSSLLARSQPAVLAILCLILFTRGATASDRLFDGPRTNEIRSIEFEAKLLEQGWLPMSLDDASARYAKGFPGRIELYGQGNRRLVVRTIERATRRFHLSKDCYRAIGYSIEPMSLLRQADGTMWSRVMATRGQERIEVRERVVSQDGAEWTDASSWFWSAFLGKTQGPWIAYSESIALP